MTDTYRAEFKALHRLTDEELEAFMLDMSELFSDEEVTLEEHELPEALRATRR